jgi:hypothetical protein
MGITGNSCFPTAEWKSLVVRSPFTDHRSLTNLGVLRTCNLPRASRSPLRS